MVTLLSPRLVDVAGASRYLAVSEDVIRDFDARGILRRVRLPGPGSADLRRVLFTIEDLDRLVEQSREEPGR